MNNKWVYIVGVMVIVYYILFNKQKIIEQSPKIRVMYPTKTSHWVAGQGKG